MPSIPEAVPGAVFLFPAVYVLVTNESFIEIFPTGAILTLAALFALPVGWLCLNLQGLILAYFHGRYENEPVMKYLRKYIQVQKKEGKYIVNLDQVLPESFDKREFSCCQQEFDKLFDPFKIFRKFPLSFRKQQSKKGETLFYVENVENITYFSSEVPSSYIREVIKYWHISYASGIALALGIICGLGLDSFLVGNLLGLILTVVVILFLVGTGGVIQPYFRKKEAIANEYLFIKLLIPYRRKQNQPVTNEGKACNRSGFQQSTS